MQLEEVLEREEPPWPKESEALTADSSYVIVAVNFFLTELNRKGGGEFTIGCLEEGKARAEMKYSGGERKEYALPGSAVPHLVERVRIMQENGQIELIDYVEPRKGQNYYLNSIFSTHFQFDTVGRSSCRVVLEKATAQGKDNSPEKVVYSGGHK